MHKIFTNGSFPEYTRYEAPECAVAEVFSEGVLCQSGDTEDYDIYNPWG